jgi:DHA2 family multidrug resistance protein
MGGAVGIATIQTFLTKRELFECGVVSSQVTLLDASTRQRLDHLVKYFLSSGISDAAVADRDAVVAVGREIRHQAFLLGFSDTVVMQSAVLGLGLAAVWFVRRVSQVPAGGQGHE